MSDKKLAKKNTCAFIIGGSSGVGFAVAEQLLKRGTGVIILGRSGEKLASKKRVLSKIGEVETLQADLYEEEDVQRVIQFVTRFSSHITDYVNAVSYFKPRPFLEHKSDDYDQCLDLNRASFFISQAVCKNMIRHGGGLDGAYWLYMGSSSRQNRRLKYSLLRRTLWQSQGFMR